VILKFKKLKKKVSKLEKVIVPLAEKLEIIKKTKKDFVSKK
jgi:hypothetical protein